MTTSLQVERGYETVLDWLQAEMQARHIAGNIYLDAVEVHRDSMLQHPVVAVPIYVEGYDTLLDKVEAMQSLSADWNGQEPEPEWALFLKPAAKPRAERQS